MIRLKGAMTDATMVEVFNVVVIVDNLNMIVNNLFLFRQLLGLREEFLLSGRPSANK